MPENLDQTRSMLEAEQAALLRRIDELTVGGEIDLEFDQDFADRAQVTGEQGENYTLAETLQTELNRVERALERLNEGTYGTCEVCGNDIGSERLEALPETSRCIEHV
jgi:RNA polymerase-binding transcription factor DksA